MSHYIDIEKAEEDFINFRCDGCECYPDGCDNCLIHEGAEFFINYDEADVKPVIHSKWIPMFVNRRGNANAFQCYGCSRTYYPDYKSNKCSFNYCPNCGAKMDAETNDNEI